VPFMPRPRLGCAALKDAVNKQQLQTVGRHIRGRWVGVEDIFDLAGDISLQRPCTRAPIFVETPHIASMAPCFRIDCQ
jgi:hypothetical protein